MNPAKEAAERVMLSRLLGIYIDVEEVANIIAYCYAARDAKIIEGLNEIIATTLESFSFFASDAQSVVAKARELVELLANKK